MTTTRRTGRLAGASLVAAAALLLAGCGSDSPDETTEPGLALPSASAADPSTPVPSTSPQPLDDDQDDPDDVADDADDAADHALVVGPAGTVADERAELDVEDQRGDGRSVVVEEVAFTGSEALVGIFDAGGNVIGSVLVEAGTPSVTIELDRRIESSQRLIAALLRDANGNGEIDDADPVLAEEGEPVIEDFDFIVG